MDENAEDLEDVVLFNQGFSLSLHLSVGVNKKPDWLEKLEADAP